MPGAYIAYCWGVAGLKSTLRRILPRRPLKLAWLTDDISICGAPYASGWQRLARQGITAVLEVRNEAEDDKLALRGFGIHYLHFSLAKGEVPMIGELEQVVEWVLDELDVGEKVLIHCDDGRQRSALIAKATLVALGFPLHAADDFLRRAQPDAELTRQQTYTLEVFAAYRLRRRKAA
ncbi:MAG: hypothetical protein GEU75_01430 [Dehalococcoidia bacterium]|nr:hypothetical protein [Dehalococcoidia bacterium]